MAAYTEQLSAQIPKSLKQHLDRITKADGEYGIAREANPIRLCLDLFLGRIEEIPPTERWKLYARLHRAAEAAEAAEAAAAAAAAKTAKQAVG